MTDTELEKLKRSLDHAPEFTVSVPIPHGFRVVTFRVIESDAAQGVATALESLQADIVRKDEALRFAKVALEGVDPPTMAGANIALRHVRAALSQPQGEAER